MTWTDRLLCAVLEVEHGGSSENREASRPSFASILSYVFHTDERIAIFRRGSRRVVNDESFIGEKKGGDPGVVRRQGFRHRNGSQQRARCAASVCTDRVR